MLCAAASIPGALRRRDDPAPRLSSCLTCSSRFLTSMPGPSLTNVHCAGMTAPPLDTDESVRARLLGGVLKTGEAVEWRPPPPRRRVMCTIAISAPLPHHHLKTLFQLGYVRKDHELSPTTSWR